MDTKDFINNKASLIKREALNTVKGIESLDTSGFNEVESREFKYIKDYIFEVLWNVERISQSLKNIENNKIAYD